MRKGWKEAQEQSAELFKKHALPIVTEALNCVCLDVEGTDSPLDVKAGIDYCLLLPDGGIQGLAVRMVQHKDYRNFALKLSELRYLRIAEQHGYLRPHYYLQAFVVAGRLKSLALVEIPALLKGIGKLKKLPIVWTQARDKRLLLVDWERLNSVIEFRIWSEDAERNITETTRETQEDT